MEARAEHQRTKNYRVIYSIATILGAVLVVLVLCWCLIYRGGFASSEEPSVEFNWHPFLMIIGLIYTYAQSMLIYRSARNSPKKPLKLAHGILHCVAFILAVLGLKAVFDSHNYAFPPIPNLYTLHSWIGLVTVIIFASQFLIGFITFLYPGMSKTWRQIILPVHTAVGVGTFISALITAMMGLTEKALWVVNDYQHLPAEGVLVNLIGVVMALFGIIVLYLVTEPDYKRAPLATDEMVLSQNE